MTKTIKEIFQELNWDTNHSSSECRRQISLGNVIFNGKKVLSMIDKVEVGHGSVFVVAGIVTDSHWTWSDYDGGRWNRLRAIDSNSEYQLTLQDSSVEEKSTITLRLRQSGSLLLVGAKGYGEYTAQDGDGFPIVIEFHEGKFRLVIWDDINKEDPPTIISLEGARESKREDKWE